MNKWIRVNGTPIPQGSKSAKVVNGRALMWDANPALKAWRENVAQAVWRAVGDQGTSEPIDLNLWFYLPKPKTVKREHPSVKPDLDKLCRAVMDGCTDGGAWTDDAQVVFLSAAKLYADAISKPGVMIWIRSLNAMSAMPDPTATRAHTRQQRSRRDLTPAFIHEVAKRRNELAARGVPIYRTLAAEYMVSEKTIESWLVIARHEYGLLEPSTRRRVARIRSI